MTLHTPLDASTRGLVDRHLLATMKPSAFLINTARGGIVVQDDLKRALSSGALAGAALDVYSEEPPADAELLALETLIATPHIGGNAQEAVLAMGVAAIESLAAHFADRRPATELHQEVSYAR